VIVVDTSALMAILQSEPDADACEARLAAEDRLLISAGTVAETLIVADRRNRGAEARRLIEGLGFEVISVTPAAAQRIAGAYARWGKGVHPASLNLGDCFAYEAAKTAGCPLLFVGTDFVRTDIEPALD
jgi:ribonuclease VapC